MKLNHDCVRDLMLAIESLPSRTAQISLESLSHHDFLEGIYDIETLAYTADLLLDAKFIIAKSSTNPGSIYINHLTWSGHEFLDNIRDNETWKATKGIVQKLSSVSLTLMGSLANAYLLKKFGLS